MVKAKLVTGAYNLEGKRQYFGKGKSGQCPLCESAIETREHFIAVCNSLSHIREKYTPLLTKLLEQELSHTAVNAITKCTKNYTQAILDPTFCCSKNTIEPFEHITRRLCYALHRERTAALQNHTNSSLRSQPQTRRLRGDAAQRRNTN